MNLKKEAFDLSNSQQRFNYEKSTSIKSERENKYVNKICFNQDRSSKHVKLNNKKSKERLEKRLAITK